MPVFLDVPSSTVRPGAYDLEIGFLNNLGDGGMEGGERQMLELLEESCGGMRVRLRLFSLPSIARNGAAKAQISSRYGDLQALLSSRLDGLFVTGAEPSTADLRDETFWPELAAVIEWAKSGTRSAVWSCLAAHAAVLHLDGILRRPLTDKCTGVFPVTAVGEHPLLAGAGEALRVCHSRWNDLDGAELGSAGYDVLTRGEMGVDSFVRSFGSLFVFLQGHPEYDAGALGREARRDLERWQTDPSHLPSLPKNYFPAATEAALLAHVAGARATLPPFGPPPALDRAFAVALIRNWLGLLGTSAARAA